jgi:hypothetical protein
MREARIAHCQLHDDELTWRLLQPRESAMAGKSIKNKDKYQALKRKGMSKTRAAKISNAGKSASRKGGRKAGRARAAR